MAKFKCWVDKEGDDYVARSPQLAITVKDMSFNRVKDRMVSEIVRLAGTNDFEITSYEGMLSEGSGHFGIRMDENMFLAMQVDRDSLIRQERMERWGKKSVSEKIINMISLGIKETLGNGKNIGEPPPIGTEIVYANGYLTDKVIGHNKDGSIEMERTIRLDRPIEYVSMTVSVKFNPYKDWEAAGLTLTQIKDVREGTGCGFKLAKDTLIKHKGDVAKAVEEIGVYDE